MGCSRYIKLTVLLSNYFVVFPLLYFVLSTFFLVSRDSGVSLEGPIFPSPWAATLALRLDCSTASLTTPERVLSHWKLVELKMLDSVIVREQVFPSWRQPQAIHKCVKYVYTGTSLRYMSDFQLANSVSAWPSSFSPPAAASLPPPAFWSLLSSWAHSSFFNSMVPWGERLP